MVRRPAFDEQLRQPKQHIVGAQMPGDLDRQALSCVLVDHREHAEPSPIMGAILDKVVGPYMVRPARPQTNARSVVEPQLTALGCRLGTFSPSRRQIRSTRLWFTNQPSRLSSAVIRR
jgi:hypothetical protein